MNLKPSPWLFVLTAFSSITQGVALPDGSVAKRDLQLYTNPTYTSPFLGDRFRANPRSRNLDDQTLVTKDREARRLAKVQVWCNDYTVFSMQPWYHGNGGPQDYLHWQYADNRHGGAYQELIISDTEYISELQYDFCGDPGQKRLCFLYLAKDPLPGHESTGDNDGITCGSLQYGEYCSKTTFVNGC